MIPSRVEKISANMFRIIFNPIVIPIYIFIFFVCITPIVQLYYIMNPLLGVLNLAKIFCTVSLVPLLYKKVSAIYNKKTDNKEIIIVTVLSVALFYFLMHSSAAGVPSMIMNKTMIATIISLMSVFVFGLFYDIDLYSSSVCLFTCLVLTYLPGKTFLSYSIVLLLCGIVLSLYNISGKSNIKQNTVAFISAIVSSGIFILVF